MDKQTALDLLDEKQDFLFSVSDSIWDHPETDYTETVSSGILMDALKKEGFTVTSGLAGIPTAFSGSYAIGRKDPVELYCSLALNSGIVCTG